MYVLTCGFCILYFTLLLFLKVLFRLIFLCMSLLPAYMYGYHKHAWCLWRSLDSTGPPETAHGWFMWVWGSELGSFATRALIGCVISPVSLLHSLPETSSSIVVQVGLETAIFLPSPSNARILGEVSQQGRILFRNLCCTLQVFTLLFTQSLNSYLSLQKITGTNHHAPL